VNGQIQYGSARTLNFPPTVESVPRTANPERFPSLSSTSRPVALLVGTSLLLCALLMAVPRDIPGIAAAVVLGGAWLSLVLAMTLPREDERAGQELVRRLAQFRHELNAIGDAPSKATLERLLARRTELGLRDDEVSEELEQIRACLGALDLKEELARGSVPTVEPPHPSLGREKCHFVCAVRFGRRRADQFGHLVLSDAGLRFRGAIDVHVNWSDVAAVARDKRDIVVTAHDSPRVLRFSCHSHEEAARGGVLAEHLARDQQANGRAASSSDHASV